MFASTVPPQVHGMIFIHSGFLFIQVYGGLLDSSLLYLCLLKLYYIKG